MERGSLRYGIAVRYFSKSGRKLSQHQGLSWMHTRQEQPQEQHSLPKRARTYRKRSLQDKEENDTSSLGKEDRSAIVAGLVSIFSDKL
ncbi:hypothetical protein Tco_1290591 [Tanacetum coccineum]